MKNVFCIVLDALGLNYIQEYTRMFPDNFFAKIEQKGISYQRLYSVGPFTNEKMHGRRLHALLAGLRTLSLCDISASQFCALK